MTKNTPFESDVTKVNIVGKNFRFIINIILIIKEKNIFSVQQGEHESSSHVRILILHDG